MPRIAFSLMLCLSILSCTSDEEEKAFIGTYKLYVNGQPSGDNTFWINPDLTYNSESVGFIHGTGTWSVSSFHTSIGVVIDFYDKSGKHVEQLHWDETVEDAEVLKDGYVEEDISKRYIKILNNKIKTD